MGICGGATFMDLLIEDDSSQWLKLENNKDELLYRDLFRAEQAQEQK